jgi:hypothetical protein
MQRPLIGMAGGEGLENRGGLIKASH